MIAQKHITHLTIGKDLNILANTATRESLATGQIGIFLAGATTAYTSALVAGDRFQIVYKKVDGQLMESPVIDFTYVKNKAYVNTAAATEQVSYIGYNGTTGSIALSNNSNYRVSIVLSDDTKMQGYGKNIKMADYTSDASATQLEVADGITAGLLANLSQDNPKMIKAERVINSAGLALGTGVDTITLKNGSKYFSATDIDNATDNAALAVGDYLRVGTGVTDPVYKIVAINTTTNIGTLDVPYQGADYAALDPNFEKIAAATAATADFGIKLTGLPGTFEVGLYEYRKISFTVLLNDTFSGTLNTIATAATSGKGVYEEVAELEWFLKGNRGEAWRVGEYPKTYVADAISGKTYDMLTFDWYDVNSTSIDGLVYSFGSQIIALEDQSSGTIHAGLKTVFGIS
jgi:hypothetical protein